MEEFVIIHHDLAIHRLNAGYCTAAGFGGADPRWNIPGNFYWVRSDHALSLPKVESLNWHHRWDAEKWIGMGGITGMYFLDFGDTVLAQLKILTSTVGAGVVTTSGYHGWEDIPHGAHRIPVLVSTTLPAFDLVISSHAPSKIEIVLKKETACVGFVCGSGRAHGWTLKFQVNGSPVGETKECSSPTQATTLPPGKHVLEILVDGDTTGAHSVWGFTFSREVEQAKKMG